MHYHIIGQGLAGSVLGIMMHERGMSFSIEDDGHQSSSSMVAAGMWNPLSFKKLHQSWNAAKLIPAAEETFTRFEQLFGCRFFHPTELVRIFPNNAQANEWDERSVHPELQAFISNDADTDVKQHFVQPFGHGMIKGSGWMDIPLFLNKAKEFFSVKNYFSRTPPADGAVIINCTGYKAAQQAGWDWLPIVPNKGQVLTLRIPELHLKRMVNFGKFIVPLDEQTFRMGATYEYNDPNEEPTEKTKNFLLENLLEHMPYKAEVVMQKAGYRPTVPDRKPLIGYHPNDTSMAVFGGFGSKGVMLVPHYAQQFIRLLTSGQEVDEEVRVSRYFKAK